MHIKKIIKTIPVLILMATTIPANANSLLLAISKLHPVSTVINNDSLKLEQIKVRLAEIQGMDRSNLTIKEKKELKKELTTMKKEATAMEGNHNGVYLSIGAIIVIILLLILILR